MSDTAHVLQLGTVPYLEAWDLQRAVAAGANVIRPLEDSPDAGMRLYTAEDCEGHRWMFGQPFATVSTSDTAG